MALGGRHGDTPIAVISASSPTDCFDVAIEAARIAIKYMTPVMLMSDGYLANAAEPWKIPDADSLPRFPVQHQQPMEDFKPSLRNVLGAVRCGTGLGRRFGNNFAYLVSCFGDRA